MKHNHIGIWLLVFAQLIITVLWYSPLLFSSVWNNELGRNLKTYSPKDSLPYVTVVFASIILCYGCSWLVQKLERTTFRQGAELGFLVFLFFVLSTMARHYKLLDISNLALLIDLGLAGLLTVGTFGILAIWKKD